VPLLEHFMRDIGDGRQDGFPSLGIRLQQLENPDLRSKYLVPDDGLGALLINVLPGSPSDGILQAGDVLRRVDGHEIAYDGTVEFRAHERTSLAFYVQQHQIGEAVNLDILRDGTPASVSVELTRSFHSDWLVPMESYDTLPSYYIFGGVVFCPLTKDLLTAWGSNWYHAAPKDLTAVLSANYPEVEGQQVILILKVLAADVNQGYHNHAHWVVDRVDGEKVLNMAELVRRVEEREDPFLVIQDKGGQQIVLDRAKARAAGPDILTTYRIPGDRSEDLLKGEVE